MANQTPIVLLTGANSGIGWALAEALINQGGKVIATARDIATLSDLQQQGAAIYQLDVTDKNGCEQLINHCIDKFGRLDMLINNAGYGQMGPLLNISSEQLEKQFAVNLFSPLYLCQLAGRYMAKQKQGCLVNLGSVSGIAVTPFSGAYCASKAALHAVDEALRMELAPFNVRVVTVQPGAIASNFGNTAQTNLPEIDAIYQPYRDGIIKRAGMSQQNATTAKQFASFVVEKLLSPKGPPNIIRYGNGSLTLPLIAKWLPASLRYALFKKAFGLSSN